MRRKANEGYLSIWVLRSTGEENILRAKMRGTQRRSVSLGVLTLRVRPSPAAKRKIYISKRSGHARALIGLSARDNFSYLGCEQLAVRASRTALSNLKIGIFNRALHDGSASA
jgi:hypothetical protein